MNVQHGFFLLVFLLSSVCCRGQCADTLHPIRFPCCVSGADWCQEEQVLYLVSDLQNKVYKAKLDEKAHTVAVFDSLVLVSSPHSKGLEAIRKVGTAFYLSYEKDEIMDGVKTARAFVAKGKYDGQHLIQIEKTLEIGNLPNNKGIESLAVTDENIVWLAHESMARPKNGLDSVKFISFDTLLRPYEVKWYRLYPRDYFEGNEAAYNDYGVSEMVARNDSFYVIERGWGRKEGKGEVFINVFRVPIATLNKSQPLYSFRTTTTPLACVDNFEALCFLPSLGKLLMISDDNNQKSIQKTLVRLIAP